MSEQQMSSFQTTVQQLTEAAADWSSIDDPTHPCWDPQNDERDQSTTGGDGSSTNPPLLVFDPQRKVSAKRSMSVNFFKPFACRFPGCQKRFCHETHTRRHERETHNYYRQRQKQHLLEPSSILNSSNRANVFADSSSQLNGSTRHRHLQHHQQQQQQSREAVALSGGSELASSSCLLHVS